MNAKANLKVAESSFTRPMGRYPKGWSSKVVLLAMVCCAMGTSIVQAAGETKVKLEWVSPNEDILADWNQPGLDFEDRGWISKTPLEPGLSGLPQDLVIQFYGIFDLSAESMVVKRYGFEEAAQYLWQPPRAEMVADSRVSFINAKDEAGEEIFYFDTDNDEDFSDENRVYPEHYSAIPKKYRHLEDTIPNAPFGVKAKAEVRFEYTDGAEIREKTVPVEVVKYERYFKERAPDKPKFRGSVMDLRVGSVEINGKRFKLAVLNGYDSATYHNRRWNEILWDLNNDGFFVNERESAESYPSEKPFNIAGLSLEVKRISPAGDEIVFGPADQVVEAKRELKVGEPAPAFAVVDMKGDTLRLADFRGRHVLLDFWFTSCGPCVKDTPKLVEIYQKKHREGLEIIGVSVDKSREAVNKYTSKHGIEWLQVLEMDNEDKLVERYNIGGFPSYVWIGPDGRIINPELKSHLDNLQEASLSYDN